jgi:hypothetical protein
MDYSDKITTPLGLGSTEGLGAGSEASQRPECMVPPLGWRCTRGEGHEGPCAAVECPEDVALVDKAMQRLNGAPNARFEAGTTAQPLCLASKDEFGCGRSA